MRTENDTGCVRNKVQAPTAMQLCPASLAAELIQRCSEADLERPQAWRQASWSLFDSEGARNFAWRRTQ